jgi:hypothetical protein
MNHPTLLPTAKQMRIRFHLPVMLVLWHVMSQPLTVAAAPIRYETAHFQLTLSGDGRVEGFTDRRNGVNYVDPQGDVSFCTLRLRKDDSGTAANKVVRRKDLLTFSFPQTPVTVTLRVKTEETFLAVDVVDVKGGDFYALRFAQVPLKIDYAKDDFAACAMSRRMNTRTADYPGRSNLLGGQCFGSLGHEGAGVALLGLPEAQLRDAMKGIVDAFAPGEMPVSKAGGPYAMDNAKNYGSYIIITEPITESEVDKWAEHLSLFGVDQVDFHQGTPFRQGDFLFNETAYPNGVSDFRKTSDAFRTHGIVTGLHTYAEFLDTKSRHVTPVPSKDLDVMRSFTLADDLDEQAQAIRVDETTADVSTVTGFFVRNSKVVRIDDELILIGEPNRAAPYGFAGCTRGAYGTRVSAHRKGAPVDHLTQMFFLFAPKKDSELFLEVARETARAYNEGGFGMIYLDALDGTFCLVEDQELVWYYEALFINEILKHVATPPLFEYSIFSVNLWYARSRMGAWDAGLRGYRPFFNHHLGANRSTADRLYLPGQMGWLKLCPSCEDGTDHFQYHILFSEDVEYLGAKTAGYNYGLSYLDIGRTDVAPFARRNGQVLKNYDLLRRSGYFSAETLAQLRRHDTHFLLRQSGADDWYVTEAHYGRALLNEHQDSFIYDNPFPAQTPMIRIEHRHQTSAYDDPAAIDLIPLDETQPVGEMVVRKFETPVDLSGHQGFGLWIYGDGGGQQINIRFDSPPHMISGHTDHFIDVDFEGWRYFSPVEAANGERRDVKWPVPCADPQCAMHPCEGIYEEYRQAVHYGSISEVRLMIAGDAGKLRFRTVRALPLTEDYMVDPTLRINGRSVTFPGRIKSGHYMEYEPGSRAIVYDKTGTAISDMTPEVSPAALPAGQSTVRYTGVTAAGRPAAARITLRTNAKEELR